MLRILVLLTAVFLFAACTSSSLPATPPRTQAPGAGTPTPRAVATSATTPKPAATPARTPTPAPTPLPTPNLSGWPAGAIGTEEAAQRDGGTATVCGAVVSAEWTPAATGMPTFLNLDRPYPYVLFNVLIWGEQRREWPVDAKPEKSLLGKTICVTGVIEAYQGVQQIAGASMATITIVPGS